MVTDFRTDTCFTAIACLLLAQHRKSVECDVDCELLNSQEADLVSTFASRVLNPKCYIRDSAETKAVARVFEERRAALLTNKKASVSEVWPELDGT